MKISNFCWRVPPAAMLTMAASLGLSGCLSGGGGSSSNDSGPPPGTYSADIQRTEFGIPHITAQDYKGLGYGVGYAFAEDNICSLAREIVVASGQSMPIFSRVVMLPATSFIPGTTPKPNVKSFLHPRIRQ